MTSIELLTRQTEDAYDWTNKLLRSIPYDVWDVTPDVVKSNISWQCGHLVLSLYYHSILVIQGHHPDILKQIPLKEYNALFTQADPENSIGKFPAETLYNQLVSVQHYSMQTIRNLKATDLNAVLETSAPPHPIAKNKFEALDWNIKHTMWHCGQIGILKRLVDQRLDFGMRVSK